MDTPRSYRNAIAVEGDRITVGGRDFSIPQVKNVHVSFYAPQRFWLLSFIAWGVFLVTVALMFGLGLLGVIAGSADSSTTSWELGLLFFGGMGAFLLTLTLAMVVYRPEWRVVLSTVDETHVVYQSRSRIAAQSYANRLNRLLAPRK